jgi:hypothetical protein
MSAVVRLPGYFSCRFSTAGQKYKNIGYFTRIKFTPAEPLKDNYAALLKGIEVLILG